MIVLSACPCCNSTDLEMAFAVKDHTVTGETFDIWHCNQCTARFTQNIPDQNEIQKYYQSENYISHSDTKQGFINSIYHYIRKRTLKSKRKLIEKNTKLSVGNILDIGAGTGAFLRTMKDAGWKVTGVEPDETARNNAQQLYGLSLLPSDDLFSLKTGSYDAITLWHVLEHVHDLNRYIHQLKNLLKPAGKIFIAVPNYTSHDAKVYREYWAAYDVPRHLYHFSPTAITQLLLQHSLQLKGIKPMWYDSFYVSMLSEKYMTGKNNLLSACWIGYLSNCKALLDKEKCSSIIYIVSH